MKSFVVNKVSSANHIIGEAYMLRSFWNQFDANMRKIFFEKFAALLGHQHIQLLDSNSTDFNQCSKLYRQYIFNGTRYCIYQEPDYKDPNCIRFYICPDQLEYEFVDKDKWEELRK